MIAQETLDPFAELVARGWVRNTESGRPSYGSALRALRLANEAALAELVSRANHSGAPFFFVGGGTRIALTPPAYLRRPRGERAMAIALDGLDRVLEYRPMDFTVTVGAGMRVTALREQLAMRGQTVMLDTPRAHEATVGGLLASAACGPRRRDLGRTRDALLGARIVLPDGTLVESGGRTQRQASGYDVARAFAGSRGALGAYAAVHLRTTPLPEARRCAIATLPEGTRSRVLASIEALPVEPTSALLVDGFIRAVPGWEGPDGRVFLSFEGSEAAITRATRDLRTALGAIGVSETRIFDRDADALLDHIMDAALQHNGRETSATIRFYGPASEAVALRNSVHHVMNDVGVTVETITDLQNGDVSARIRAFGGRTLELAAREIVGRLGDAIDRAELLDAAPGFRRGFFEALERPTANDAVMRTLKAQLDPRGLCAVDPAAFG